MIIDKVKNIEEAISKALLLIPNNSDLNICLTGGKFGENFLESLLLGRVIKESWEIFLSDERLYPNNDEKISSMYIQKLSSYQELRYGGLHTFEVNVSPDESYSDINSVIETRKISKFDICFLSLGEDGHLAGHFKNSIPLKSEKFCYTQEAPKLPQHRVSFDISWLRESSKLVIAALGSKKKEALNDLLNGQGTHSSIVNYDNLTILTDIDIRRLDKL